MVTRVRVEAEGSTIEEVEEILNTVREVLTDGATKRQKDIMFGQIGSNSYQALENSEAGEFVVERFARDTPDEPGDGAIVYRGRSTSHFAMPSQLRKLGRRLRSSDGNSGELFD